MTSLAEVRKRLRKQSQELFHDDGDEELEALLYDIIDDEAVIRKGSKRGKRGNKARDFVAADERLQRQYFSENLSSFQFEEFPCSFVHFVQFYGEYGDFKILLSKFIFLFERFRDLLESKNSSFFSALLMLPFVTLLVYNGTSVYSQQSQEFAEEWHLLKNHWHLELQVALLYQHHLQAQNQQPQGEPNRHRKKVLKDQVPLVLATF
jgi:hypothetical protein